MRKIALLVFPDFSSLGLAATIEPLFVANWLAQSVLFTWVVVSTNGKAVRASNGRLTEVDGDLRLAEDCKSVFVLASFDTQRAARQRHVVRWLAGRARVGVELAGLENGSLLLAAAGLLNGHVVAVHWDNLMGFQEHYPKVRAVPQLYARSGRRVTCAGACAIIDLMIAWLGWHAEPGMAAEVADHLLVNRPRQGEIPQRGADAAASPAGDPTGHPTGHPTGDPVITRARALMRAHIEEPLTCRDLAQRLGLSLRQIERRFKDQLQCSVLQLYRQIRMTKAHQLLQQTTLSVTQVALTCGFTSPEYFCRLYRDLFHRSPSTDRRQSTDAPVLRRRMSRGA